MTNQLKKFPNDNVTCIGPWYELRIDANGNMRGCHAISQDCAEKSDKSFLDWFNNGDEITIARNNLSSGTEYRGCNQCYENEKLKLTSFRQRRNLQAAIYSGEYFKESLKQSPAYKRMTGQVKDFYPAFMHVTLSNLCNLSCRMCFPSYSSQLATVYKKLGLQSMSEPTLYDWTTDENKWQSFLDIVKNNNNLMSLHFMGGEPLYHKKFIEFIDWCIKNNKTDFHLTFVTNGTIYNKELIKKLKKFKSTQIEISIENFHSSNDYIRQESDFTSVKNNILDMLKDLTNKSVVLRSVPQALSISNYDTLIDFALENQITIDNNVLHNPMFLKCFVLPKELKNQIGEYLKHKYAYILSIDSDNILHSARIRTNDLSVYKKHIESILIQLNEPEPDNIEDLRKKFVEFNKKLDTLGKYKFVDIYPMLKEFYAKYSTI